MSSCAFLALGGGRGDNICVITDIRAFNLLTLSLGEGRKQAAAVQESQGMLKGCWHSGGRRTAVFAASPVNNRPVTGECSSRVCVPDIVFARCNVVRQQGGEVTVCVLRAVACRTPVPM
jgi:hypothetical protein